MQNNTVFPSVFDVAQSTSLSEDSLAFKVDDEILDSSDGANVTRLHFTGAGHSRVNVYDTVIREYRL